VRRGAGRIAAPAPIDVVLGLGFGDEGKGSIVDWLARRRGGAVVVVRWNGGPQAMHHVVTDDGRVHCFAQLGSASFIDGARTHLGPEMIVDPYALLAEADAIAAVGVPGALARVTIDPRAVLVTPWHAIVGRVREVLRGIERHGSTGRGIAEARHGAVRVTAADLGRSDFADRALAVREAARATLRELEAAPGAREPARSLAAHVDRPDLLDAFLAAAHSIISSDGGSGAGGSGGVVITPDVPRADAVILEGAQGALLDRDHGFFPHVTPSRITRRAAEDAALAMGLAGPLTVWGVLRAVHTRHGAGPLPSYDAELTARLPEPHNPDGSAGPFRVGWFDAVLARYALAFAGPIDRLAITCVDRVDALPAPAVVDIWPNLPGSDLTSIDPSRRTALAQAATPRPRPVSSIVPAIESLLGRSVDLESRGMTAADKLDRARHSV
jgi:adenylosuccinate synthase